MKHICIIIFLAVLVPFSISAQTTFRDSLLDRMEGNWILTGTIEGQKTTHDVTASWILAHQYFQFHEISREKDSTGKALYEAQVTIDWNAKLHQYACLWLDVTGGGGIVSGVLGMAERNGDTIPFLFKMSGSLFHTTFSYDAASDTWQWIMDGEENGTLQLFARLTMSRK